MFYFAWVNKEETTFGPEHIRTDEVPFTLEVQQSEGDFAALVVDLINPREGLLAPGRKRWVWVSYRKADTTVVPLFFGRLVGVPSDLQDNMVRLTFVARPVDFVDQKEALATTLRVAPYYDPVWLSDQDQLDPDSVLEGYSRLWHVDRVTGEVTTSDIITGEDGLLTFEEEVFYDSLRISFGDSPARKVVVDATVNWQQYGSGEIDITQDLLREFRGQTSNGVYSVDGEPRTSAGVINIIPGEQMIDAWPKFGQSIGGGWTVGASEAKVAGPIPLPPTLLPNREAYSAIQHWKDFPGSPNALRSLFDRAPGFVVEIEDTTQPWMDQYGWAAHGPVNVLWVPIWQIAIKMRLHWEAARDRTEVIQFEVEADVQPLLSEPGEEEVIYLSMGPADVDSYIGDRRRDIYFRTTRGAQSVQNLLARARAHLLARARAVDVTFSVPFEDGLAFSCRKSASVADPRIPGGIAAGKIKAYSLAANGDSGELLATATIGCTVGRDGTIEVVPGVPTYVADGYANAGYQETEDEVVVPFPGDLGYTMNIYHPVGDGVNFYSVSKSLHLLSLEVNGGLDTQQAEAGVGSPADITNTGAGVMDKINGYKTQVKLTLRPVVGGPFVTNVSPVVTDLKVPRTIDLESA